MTEEKNIEYDSMTEEIKQIISDHATGGNDIKENFSNFYSLNKNLKESFEEIKKLLLEIKDTQGIIPCSNDSQCVCNDFDLIIDDIEILETKFYD